MKIILSGQPLSTGHIYRYTCRGSWAALYMIKEGKEMKEKYVAEAKEQYKGEIIPGKVEVVLNFFFKDKRVRDIDNYNKLVLDALSGIVYYDDKQIVKLTIEKFISKKNPRVELEIEEKKERQIAFLEN